MKLSFAQVLEGTIESVAGVHPPQTADRQTHSVKHTVLCFHLLDLNKRRTKCENDVTHLWQHTLVSLFAG